MNLDPSNSFLFRFDYASKVKFVIGVAMFAALFLLYTLIQVQKPLKENNVKQGMGVEYEQKLYRILKEAIMLNLNIPFWDQTNQAFLEAQTNIDEMFVIINQLNAQFNQRSKAFNPIRYEQFRNTLSLLELQWIEINEKIRDKKFDEEQFTQWIENIYDATLIAEKMYGLNLNFDRTNESFMQIYSHDIPSLKMKIFHLYMRYKTLLTDKVSPFEDVHALVILKEIANQQEEIWNELKDAIANSQFVEKNHDVSFKSNLFNALSESLNSLQAYFTRKKTTQDDSILNGSNHAIQQASALQENIGNAVKLLLSKQKEILDKRMLISTLLIIFGTIIVLTLYMTRVIRRPLADLKNAVMDLADGNLSVRVKISSQDEVAHMSKAFNKMAEFFEEVMLDAGEISTHLAQSSSNIFSTAKQLESSLEKQERSIHQIAANAKGISQTVQDFARSLQDVNNAATLTTHLAILSKTTLTEMETIMQQMANASIHIVETLSVLKEKVGSISAIISTIVKISDQVNLLSLNTAIRAGKKGLQQPGFSVIAEKIRELADQTAYATLDMEQVVEQIIAAVMEAVIEVESFSKKIQKQLEEAVEIRELLKKLIGHTQTQISSFGIVNIGMQDQTKRAAQIHEAIRRLTEAAQRTSQSIRNLYLEIEYLYHATNNLHEKTSTFTANSISKANTSDLSSDPQEPLLIPSQPVQPQQS